MKAACSGALVTCSGHLEGCISFMEKDVFERKKKWILPFSAVSEQIVCVSVSVCACIFSSTFAKWSPLPTPHMVVVTLSSSGKVV